MKIYILCSFLITIVLQSFAASFNKDDWSHITFENSFWTTRYSCEQTKSSSITDGKMYYSTIDTANVNAYVFNKESDKNGFEFTLDEINGCDVFIFLNGLNATENQNNCIRLGKNDTSFRTSGYSMIGDENNPSVFFDDWNFKTFECATDSNFKVKVTPTDSYNTEISLYVDSNAVFTYNYKTESVQSLNAGILFGGQYPTSAVASDFSNIPEPSTYALLFGLASLAFIFYKKQK